MEKKSIDNKCLSLIKLVHRRFFAAEDEEGFIHRVLTSQDREVYIWNGEVMIDSAALANEPLEGFISEVSKMGYSVRIHLSELVIYDRDKRIGEACKAY